MSNFFQFMYNMLLEIPSMWNWLITPIDIGGLFNIAPLYLMVGTAGVIIGIVRAIA